MNNSVVP